MDIKEFTLENEFIKFKFLNYGAIVTSMFFKQLNEEVVLSYDNYDNYINNPLYLGASIIGPYAGRIEDAKYSINNREVMLDKNYINKHSIHGGNKGLDKVYFDVDLSNESAILTTTFNSLSITIIFTLINDNLQQEIKATTTEPTVFNPTNHIYFNIGNDSCLDYNISIQSDYMYYLNNQMIPTRKIDTNSTSFKLLDGSSHLKDIENEQFKITKFIDHPFHLTGETIVVSNRKKNLSLVINTKSDFAVIYCGNYLGGEMQYVNNKVIKDFEGICIEPQNIPNGINLSDENNSILYPEEEFYYCNSYRLEKI